VRCFFADVRTWATEPGSPFAAFAPPAVPLERHDLVGVGFEKARRRQASRTVANIIDLERGIGPLRALALRRWHDSQHALAAAPGDPAAVEGSRRRSGTGRCWSCCSKAACASRKRAS